MAQPSAPQTSSRPATDSTRQRLLASAYEVLVDEGYQAATVQTVARRANLTTGAIYANFTSKHELLVQAVLERWAQSPELDPLHLLTSPAAEPPGGADPALGDAPGHGGRVGDPVSDRLGDRAGDQGEPESNAGSPRLEDLVGFLADQIAAAPAPEHRLLTEVTGAAIRHDTAKSRLRDGIALVENFARQAIQRAQAEGQLDQRFPADVLVALAVNLYLGSITAKSFDLPQPGHDAVLQAFHLLARHPDHPADLSHPDS